MNLFARKSALLLFLIIVFAFWVRFWHLGSLPAFHGDEADFAENAYAFLQTGKDQFGQPFFFGTTSTGDFRPAAYVYLAAVAIKALGFNEVATRLPTVVFALLTVLAVYAVAREIWKDENIALLSSFLLAASFWHVTLSREASEKIVALFLITVGIYAVLKYMHGRRLGYLLLGFGSFFLSIHTYYAPRPFLLVFLPAVLFIFRKKMTRKQLNLSAAIAVVLLVLIIFFTFFYKTSGERLKQLSIFNTPQTSAVIDEQIREDGQNANVLVTRAYHNKIVGFTLTFLSNYSEYLSGRYLFIEGGFPARVKVPQVGLLNIIELPFLLGGLYLLVSRLKSKLSSEHWLLLAWSIVALVPAALTYDEVPNLYRTVLVLPALNLITAYGFVTLMQKIKRQLPRIVLLFGLGAAYLGMFTYFWHQYTVHYEVHHPWFRNFAHKALAETIQKEYQKAQWIFVPQIYGGVEQMMRFYLGFQPQPKIMTGVGTGKFETFKNILFTPEICPYPRLIKNGIIANSSSYVYVNAPECSKFYLPTDAVERVITWKDGNPAYEILRGKDTPP